MKDLISVIIPIYNVEKYLSKCIRSIIKQTYRNLEIILVDDGSPDNSLKICTAFAKKDKRIRVISQKNAGVSAARNRGITVSTGKYICFVDSDDWLPEDAIEQLYLTLNKENVQMSLAGIKEVRILETVKMPCSRGIIDISDHKRIAKYIYLEGNQISVPYAKLFLADIIRENNLRYDVNMKYAQDAEFVFNYLKYCDRIALTDSCVYFYNKLNPNQSTKKYWPQKNQWIYQVMKGRIALFDGNLDDEIKWMAMHYLLLWLPRLFGEAVRYNTNRENAILKIQETCDLFSAYIWDDLIVKNPPNSKDAVDYMKYRSFLVADDYDGIYDYFLKKEVIKKKSKVKEIVKKVVFWARQKMIFAF